MAVMARAVWAWAPAAGDPVDPDALMSFVDRSELDEVYLAVPWDLDGHCDALRATVARLRARNVTVSALGGEPGWAERPEHARRWSERTFGTFGFDRLHLDIEPWTRPDWDQDRERLIEGYLEAIRAAKAASGRPCDVDVAHFLPDVRTPDGTLLSDVLAVADGLVVMAYRDSADGVVSVAEPAVAAATRAGRSFRIGIQAGLGPDSFEPAAAVERACHTVFRHFRDRPGCAGIAVHHHLSWQALNPNS